MVRLLLAGHGKLTSGMKADLKQGKNAISIFVNRRYTGGWNKFDVETPLTDRL